MTETAKVRLLRLALYRQWQKEVDALWYRVKTRDVYRSVIMHRVVGAG